jgi:hypothetical protein
MQIMNQGKHLTGWDLDKRTLELIQIVRGIEKMKFTLGFQFFGYSRNLVGEARGF